MTKHMIMNASRGSILKFENVLSKLYKCNANIYFNKQRRMPNVTAYVCFLWIHQPEDGHKRRNM